VTPYYQDDAVTIYHGDCLDLFPVWDLAGGVMVTDPPYGIGYETGRHDGERFPTSIANDHSTEVRDDVLALWAPRPSVVFGSPRAESVAGSKSTLIWHKPGSGMGDLDMPWKPDWELIFVSGAGFSGSRGSSVLTYPLRVFRGSLTHPNEKPIELLHDLVAKCAPLAEIVDPFMGSGTTLRAAKDLGRKAIGIEIEERYCEIAAKRMAQEVLAL
jgi:site-specific DNA-methyltransferase (adenine-specific)